MQIARVSSTVASFVLCGVMGVTYAQDRQQGEKQRRPDQHQGRQQQAAPQQGNERRPQGQAQRVQAPGQPQQRQRSGQPARQPDRTRAQQQRSQPPQQQLQRQRAYQQQPQRSQQQAVAWQQQRGWQQQGSWQGMSTWQQGRAQRWESEHRTWMQRGGYGGYYIPQDRFTLSFGRRHWFRMHSRPTLYMGYPRFAYGGFSFLLVDPWPEYWDDNWWEADDVYIDYDDGYYLFNRRQPSVRLAITVVL